MKNTQKEKKVDDTARKATPIINDFRSGELTPGLDARADIREYYKGCRILLNAMPIIEGGVERVPGTYYVRPTKFDDEIPYIPPWSPPLDCLWAWFKHDEGSGIIIKNYAGVAGANMGDGFLTDNTFASPPTDQQRNYFWNTTPGFGTCSGNWNNSAKSTGLDAIGRTSGYVSLVAFVKPMGATGFFNSYSMISLGHTGTLNFLQLGWRDNATPNYWSFQPGTILSPTESPTFGEWHCIYAQNRAGSWGLGELHIRKSGDSDWTAAVVGQHGANAGTQQRVATSGAINNSCYVIVGDTLFYIDSTAAGMIGLTQATDIYNNLKSRYGMS